MTAALPPLSAEGPAPSAMNIAMVSEHASPLAVLGGVDAGGQNVYVAALATALAARGHEVTVYTRRDSASLPDRVELPSGVVVEHVPAGPATDMPKDSLLPHMPAFARHLRTRWADVPPDIVHAHFWMSGLAALSACRPLSVPVVQTFHALGSVKRRHQGGRDTSPPERLRIERSIGREASHILATCSDEVSELLRMGVRRPRVSVVPCGVDVGHFTPTGPAMPRTGGMHRLLTVSRLVERKGDADVVRALRNLPDTELLVVGGSEVSGLHADPQVERLHRVAEAEGVRDRVRFLGRVDRAEMPAVMRSADVVVCVPWYEPFGIVPLEAMASGVPVVAAAVGGLTDTVVDGVTGVLVPPRNPDRLADVLQGLLGDPLAREAYGLAGLERIRQRYSWQQVAEDTEGVYAGVLSGAARGVGLLR